MREIRIQPQARRDLLDTYRNLREIFGPTKAEHFQSNAFQTFRDLAGMPNMGAPRRIERDPHRDLRMWRIRDFEEYQVFYSVEPEFVRISRVIHAKRNYRRQIL
jgi:plasmid stabilization system protein ParE